jgi:hypothetical protein
MPRADSPYELPRERAVPIGDGAGDHLMGMVLPSLPLRSSPGRFVDVASLPGITVVYVYPRIGRPDQDRLKGGMTSQALGLDAAIVCVSGH